MNSKQFVSSLIFSGVDFGVSRFPFIGRILSIPLRLVFPTMAYERMSYSAMRASVLGSVYLCGVLLCFALQAVLAWMEGKLGEFDFTFAPDATGRIAFLDDPFNLANYLVIVPLYLVAGTGFMISLFSLRERLYPAAERVGMPLDDTLKPLLSGVGAVAAFMALLIYTQSGYAVDVTENSDHFFWFHGETRHAPLSRNGYAYLVLNTFLASFVIAVALLHLEMFRWSRVLSESVRAYSEAMREDAETFLEDGNRLKEVFSPFTETAIWSKAFAMALALNIFTWKLSGVAGGSEGISGGPEDENTWFFRFIVVVYLVLVLWIVSLPRYRLQWEIFRIRQKRGVHEYFDIRMPWTIGWSVFIDVLLLFLFSVAIFGSSDLMDLTMSLFEG